MIKNILVYDVPVELHRKFKTYCAANDVTMSSALKEFMKAATAETIVQTGTAQTILTNETVIELDTEKKK